MECTKFSFGAIWFLALFEVIAAVILGISPYEMNIHPPRKKLQVACQSTTF